MGGSVPICWQVREITVPSKADYDAGIHLNLPDVAVDSKINHP